MEEAETHKPESGTPEEDDTEIRKPEGPEQQRADNREIPLPKKGVYGEELPHSIMRAEGQKGQTFVQYSHHKPPAKPEWRETFEDLVTRK